MATPESVPHSTPAPAPAPRPMPETVPAEFLRFLALPTNPSLLIRGEPGSGKTSLALALLERFPGRRILITTRTERDKLRSERPYLATGQVGIEIAESDDPRENLRWTSQAINVLRARQRAGLAPARSATAETEWLPPAVRGLWRGLDPKVDTLVAIDSWDALVEAYVGPPTAPRDGIPDRAELERLLLRQIALAGVRIALVLETAGPSQLDYLVDGILTTSRQTVDDRLERWVSLDKLRGVRINGVAYPFSLHDGRFESFRPWRRLDSPSVVRPEADAAPVAGFLWPGAGEFERAFGRLPYGRYSLLELDAAVPDPVVRLLVDPLVLHALGVGGRVSLLPPTSALATQLLAQYADLTSVQTVKDRLRVLAPPGVGLPDASRWAPSIVWPEANGRTGSRSKAKATNGGTERPLAPLFEFLQAANGGASAHLALWYLSGARTWLDATHPEIGGDQLQLQLQAEIAGSAFHGFVAGRADDPLLPVFARIAGLHLRIQHRQGHFFVCGRRPWTPQFVLSEAGNSGDGTGPYRLTPVV
jgi:KaiC/GvpD/RAD55 family RecA-like ATPase